MNYPSYPSYPAQQPGAPVPGYGQAPQYPQQMPPAYAPQQAPQQYMPGVATPPAQPPAQPLANGSLADYYSQPSGGGGPAISWANKPDGTTYAGIVARDVGDGDVQQQTDPKTQQPKFYRDGRPQFVMKVPLRVQPSQEFPEGEAVLFVRGQMRDELVRAMSEAGVEGAPKGGDAIQVTLTHRKPSRGGGNPMNVFAIRYTPAAGGAGAAPQSAPAPEPQQQAQPVQPAQQAYSPVPEGQYQQAPPAPQQYAQAPAQQVQPPQAQPQQQAPAPQPSAGAPAVPEGLSPEQAQLLAQLTGGQQG